MASNGEDLATDRSKGSSTPNGVSDVGKSSEESQGNNNNNNTSSSPSQPQVVNDCPSSPTTQPQPVPYYLPHLTPQTSGGYYLYQHQQVTPEPPSPATSGYDVTSFMQQQALGVHHAVSNPFGTTQYGGLPQAPLSPGRTTMSGVIPPASPLFPRATTAINMAGSFDQQNQLDTSALHRMSATGGVAPPSPSIPYMSPQLGSSAASFGGVYQGYMSGGVSGNYGNNSANGTSSDNATHDDSAWNDRTKQQSYTQASPQLQSQVLQMQFGPAGVSRGSRTYSFDEMLPPSMLDQDQSNPSFSPYSGNTNASNSTPFPHQATWGYGGSADLYNPPQSPLQPRQSHPLAGHFPGAHVGAAMHHQMGHYGGHGGMPFYQATSPGPPIQTTASNKGPDGANLFIFHIPNHFTNLDMYRLFCQYGNLLSVRIMVEKDTGRSRGFGFVSYDSPESAALAIKNLNGFAIGNKRLKVQHKQIKPGDQQRSYNNGNQSNSDGSYLRPELPQGPSHNLGISSTPWYRDQKPSTQPANVVSDGQDNQHSIPSDLDVKHDESARAGLQSDGAKQGVDLTRAGSSAISPLASLEPLRKALPDVAGHAGPVE